MSRKIRLTFNKNQDRLTREYRIYRSIHPNVAVTDILVAKIAHSVYPTPVRVVDELADRISSNAFQLPHRYIIEDSPLRLKLGQNTLKDDEYVMDFEKGIITVFKEHNVLEDLIAEEYWFDGIEFKDSEEEQENVKEYHGPSAHGSIRPSIPPSVTFGVNDRDEGGFLDYESADVEPETFHYRIEALSATGDRSELSEEQSIMLTQEIVKYHVQRSHDGGRTWVTEGESQTLSYNIEKLDYEPPEPVKLTEVETIQVSDIGAEVVIEWETPLENKRVAKSPLYRVMSVTESGVMSNPTNPVGGVDVKTDLDHVCIRRKVWDGTYPTYDGRDAITLVELTNLEAGVYTDPIERYVEYAYSVFVVDKAGNYSEAATFTAKFINMD